MRAILAVILLSLWSVAHATDRSWSNEQIAWGAAALALAAVDYGQTLDIAKNPDKFKELNKFLGPHPTTAEVSRYFAIYVPVVAALAHFLPEHRDTILKVYVGVQVVNTVRNFHVGLRLNF